MLNSGMENFIAENANIMPIDFSIHMKCGHFQINIFKNQPQVDKTMVVEKNKNILC